MDGWLRILISKLFIGKFSFGLGVGTHHGAGSQILPTLGPGSRPFNIWIFSSTWREYIRGGIIVVSVGVDRRK
jgi:predicted ABC-type sugar transport system permease subunit